MISIDVKMAWRNMWRNTRRTTLTISAIAFACLLLVFMLSFQFGSYETMINSSVMIHAGHLQIQAAGYHEKQNIRQTVTGLKDLEKRLKEIPEVSAFSFRANAFVLISAENRTYGAMITGIDPEREPHVSTLKESIRQGRYFPDARVDGGMTPVLLGQLLATNLKVKPGDEITVMGQARDGSIAATVLKVQGIFRSGIDEFDRSSIHIPLHDFQNIFNMGNSAHRIVITCHSLKNVTRAKNIITQYLKTNNTGKSLVVLDWEELMPGLRQGIEMDLISGIIFYILLVIVVAFSIMNTFLMAIFERTREFGVLMAIGTRPGRLTKLLMIESISITLIGIAAGIIVGSIITWYFQIHGIDFSGSSELLSQYGISGRMYPKLSPLSTVSGPAVVFFITLIAAFYPALKVKGLKPVDAITYK